MNRIRYSQTSNPSVLESVKMFQHPNNGARFKIQLNTETMEYVVIDDVVNMMVKNGRGSSLHKLKIKAKEALEECGIQFTKESRNVNESQ